MQQSQANPPATTTAVSTAPTPEVSFFSVDYINSVSGSAGPRGAQAAAHGIEVLMVNGGYSGRVYRACMGYKVRGTRVVN